ncbi:MAG: AtpZ/AtpI family protein, partial [Candidatus Omnitrophota bacterium]
EVYKRIRIAGLISFIPIMLAAGPISGFLLGEYIEQKFKFPHYILYIAIGIGFAAGIKETIRIIRLVIKIDKNILP